MSAGDTLCFVNGWFGINEECTEGSTALFDVPDTGAFNGPSVNVDLQASVHFGESYGAFMPISHWYWLDSNATSSVLMIDAQLGEGGIEPLDPRRSTIQTDTNARSA